MRKKYSKKNNRKSKTNTKSKINKSQLKNGSKSKINKNDGKFKKIGGKAKIGPYFAVDNIYLPSYSRYGAPGTSKNWRGGINLN